MVYVASICNKPKYIDNAYILSEACCLVYCNGFGLSLQDHYFSYKILQALAGLLNPRLLINTKVTAV